MYESAISSALGSLYRSILKGDGEEEAKVLKLKPGHHGMEAHIDCEGCKAGRSSMMDPACRRCVFGGLAGKGEAGRLYLERDFVREYGDDSLATILEMTSLIDDFKMHAASFKKFGCGKCDGKRKASLKVLLDGTLENPAEACRMVNDLTMSVTGCTPCVRLYSSFLGRMNEICGMYDISKWKYDRIVPFMMPRFSTSRILARPPEGAVFLRAYDVDALDRPPLHVAIYEMPYSLEKLYFIIPWEYALDEADLSLIVNARDRLLRRKPDEYGFLDTEAARSYFRRHAKEAIMTAAGAANVSPDAIKIKRLTSALVKYTSGLGVLEDVLLDPHIQDAYINSPSGLNALHVVVEGEECASNVYLSGADVEAMISRLRAISGRPFSEASPVLDMDLGEFHTRVSVIGDPLSRGLAYAFRRHKKTPWTLPLLIKKGMLSTYAAGLLSFLIDGQSSVLVTGTRGAGKTSLLAALMLEVPSTYRMLVIEDTSELPVDAMQRHGWKAQGIGTRASVSGSEAEFEASDALRAALRLGESALVMGEVRGPEAKALYEAMRVGASGNSVMGTIHGASCKDVYERVVHDIGIEPASFRATDAVAVCSMVRHGGGAVRERRVTQVSEVVKGERDDEDVFNDLLRYDPSMDMLAPTDYIDTGRSEALMGIAKKWGITLEEAVIDIRSRERMLDAIVKEGKHSLMEISGYARCAGAYRMIKEKTRCERGKVDHEKAFALWEEWLRGELRDRV